MWHNVFPISALGEFPKRGFNSPLWPVFLSIFFLLAQKEYARRRQKPAIPPSFACGKIQLPLHKGGFKGPKTSRPAKKASPKEGNPFSMFHVKQFIYYLSAYIAIPLFLVAMLQNFKAICLQSGADFVFPAVNDTGANENSVLGHKAADER